MGRMTRLEEIKRSLKEDEEETDYFVLVKFEKKPSPRYYTNRGDIRYIDKTTVTEYRAYTTTSRRKAISHEELARHYGADTIVIIQREDQIEVRPNKYVSGSSLEAQQINKTASTMNQVIYKRTQASSVCHVL